MSNRRAFSKRLHLGLASPDAERPKLLTLTSRPGEMPYQARALLGRRFAEMRRRLERAFPGCEINYAGAVEVTRAGGVHFHVVLRGVPFMPQAVWSRLAGRVGFGFVLDIRQVRSVKGMGGYLTKQLGGYLTKQANSSAWPAHFRRVRFSRRWAEGWVVRGQRPRQPGAPVTWRLHRVLNGSASGRLLPPAPILAGQGRSGSGTAGADP